MRTLLSILYLLTGLATSYLFAIFGGQFFEATEATYILFVVLALFSMFAPEGVLLAVCAKITKNLVIDCDNPPVGGVNDLITILNFDDIDSVTRNIANNLVIEGIALASGTKAYTWEGKNNSFEAQHNLVKQRYSEVFDHEVIAKVFTNTPADKKEIEDAIKGRFVIIVKNNHKTTTGDTTYEIYGLDTGLVVPEEGRNLVDADTQGAYNVIFRSSDEVKEPHIPATFFLTNLATTKALVDALSA